MDKIAGLESKAPILSRERGISKGRGPSHPNFHNELFQIAGWFMQ